MGHMRNFILSLAMCIATHVGAQVEPLRFLASNSWAMPYGDIQDGRITGGIVFDMAVAIGEAMKQPVTFLVMPRNRTDAAVIAGNVDLRCYVNPAWTKIANLHVWTKPLFDSPNVMVGRSSSPPLTNVSQIPPGIPIGMVLGFVYPELDELVASGALVRDNANDQEINLRKLSLGRFPYAVVNDRVLSWFRQQNPTANIAKWQLPLGKSEFYCAAAKTARTDPQRIITAIERLKSSGRLDIILAKYQ
jgi:polar amino acid transport system substrate-binding protein